MVEEENESTVEEQGALEEPGETDEKGLGEFVTVSMRGPKRGIYEQLLTQLLIKSNRTNNPLIKIMSICEAALMSRQKDKLDMDHVDTCYAVCRSFLNTEPEREKKNMVRVTWSFPHTEENWKRYIEPWNRTLPTFYPLETPHRHHKYPRKPRYYQNPGSPWDQCKRWNKELDAKDKLMELVFHEIMEMPKHERFFEVTAALDKESFQVLQGEFTDWGLRQLMETQAIISEEIDPQVWKEAVGVFAREPEGEEE